MQQDPLLDAQSLSVVHAETNLAPVDRESRTGRFAQGTALRNTASHVDQVRTRATTDGKRTED